MTRVRLCSLLYCSMVMFGCAAFAERLPSEAEMEETISAAATYEAGQNVEAFRRIEGWVRESVSNPAFRVQLEAQITKLLGTGATLGARRFACKQLGII